MAARRTRSRRDAARVHTAGRRDRRLPQLRGRRAGNDDAVRARLRVPARAAVAVHHANIRVDPTPASRRLEAADPAPGYEGAILHSADYPDGHFLGWTPGQATPLGVERPRLAARSRQRSGPSAPPAAERQTRARPAVDRPLFHQRAAGANADDRPARTAGPRHSGRRGRSPHRRRVRAAGGRRSPRHPAARALSRAKRQRLGDAAGRGAAAADPDPQLGFQLAGSVPVRDAVLGAGGDEARDGVHVRQLRRQPEEPDAAGRPRRAGDGDRPTRWPTSGFR